MFLTHENYFVFASTDQKITSTPLLEYLANVRQERRDERKRKIEDRKRHREEEKQRKKNQVAKSMPKTIEEDVKVMRATQAIHCLTFYCIENKIEFLCFCTCVSRKMMMES